MPHVASPAARLTRTLALSQGPAIIAPSSSWQTMQASGCRGCSGCGWEGSRADEMSILHLLSIHSAAKVWDTMGKPCFSASSDHQDAHRAKANPRNTAGACGACDVPMSFQLCGMSPTQNDLTTFADTFTRMMAMNDGDEV